MLMVAREVVWVLRVDLVVVLRLILIVIQVRGDV